MASVLIKIGGIYHILFAVFHLFWPRLFNWDHNLKSLDQINRSLLPIMSGLFIYIYLLIGIGSLFFTNVLISEQVGQFILIAVSGFWAIRSLMQVRYFNMREKEVVLFFGIFICGVLLYVVPVFQS